MKTINEIREEQQKKLFELFKSLGIFFAFNQAQFNKQKKEGIDYIPGAYGMVLPKEITKDFDKEYAKLTNEKIAEFNANVPMDDFICHELWSHECFYHGDYLEIFERVKAYYPQCKVEDIERVYLAQIEAENNK